jgi:putative component of toxin-antitoxin plasmid stabilization module
MPLDALRQWRRVLRMEFIRFASFEKSASNIFLETDILELELFLSEHPEAGDLIPHGRGLRKLRRAAKGHGKRGGARVIYYHVVADSIILLICAYAKNEQGDLTPDQLKIFSTIVKKEFP